MESPSLRIAVIGAGPAGIAVGHALLERGFEDFTIFEKESAVGGTWHIHTYPGLACDVWAHSYTFSYAPNPDWSASFVEQPEIEAYLQRCATQFGLDPHIRLETLITAAHYQEGGTWQLVTEAGETLEFDVVINAMGNQHTPLFPDVEGMDEFEGPSWHGTRWNHEVDLRGKRVAIVGSAASAVQIVPEVAKVAGHLTVLQRSPNWIMPRGRKAYSERQRALFRRFPVLVRLTQRFQRFLMSFVYDAVTIGHKRMQDFEKRALAYIASAVPDQTLREHVTPKSQFGCKRGLVSDDFYPALMRDNVELVPSGLARVRKNSLVTSEGREIDVDVIVYCTGYRILDFDRIDVRGEGGRSLADVMEQAPEAFKGIATPGFPNYFFSAGPNGLTLDVPYFVTIERNVKTIVQLLAAKQAAGAQWMSVRRDLHDEYNAWLQARFPLYSWAGATCTTYYTTAEGRSPFLFAGDFKTYEKFHAESGLHEYELG